MGVCKKEEGNGWRIYGYTGGNMVICWLAGAGVEDWPAGVCWYIGHLYMCVFVCTQFLVAGHHLCLDKLDHVHN